MATQTTTVTTAAESAQAQAQKQADLAAKAKQLADIQKRLAEIKSEWDANKGKADNRRDTDIAYAAQWMHGQTDHFALTPQLGKAESIGKGIINAAGGLLGGSGPSVRTEDDERKTFAATQLSTGRTRADAVKEFTNLTQQQADLEKDLKTATGMPTASDAVSAAQQAAQTQQQQQVDQVTNDPTSWMGSRRLIPVITDKDLQDLARSGSLDLTPDQIGNLYMHQVEDPANPGTYKVTPDVNAFADPNQVQVNWDRKTPQQIQQGEDALAAYKGGGDLAQQSNIDAAAKYRADVLAGGPENFQGLSIRDALNKPFTMTREDVSALGVKLFQAGYLDIGKQYDPKKPLSAQFALGDPYDLSFRKAYLQWMNDTFADRTKSAQEILQNRITATKPVFDDMARQVEKDRAAKLSQLTRLSDPMEIKQKARDLMKTLTGSDFISDADVQRYVDQIHSGQTAAADATMNAQDQIDTSNDSGIATQSAVTDYNPDAQLQGMIEKEHPTEIAGKREADQYEQFLSLLGPAGGRI